MVLSKKWTKIDQVIHLIMSRIKTNEILPGGKLPSLRKLAQELDMSVSTVLEAYERLIADRKIEVRRGAGYYVKDKPYIPHIDTSKKSKNTESDPFWVAHQALVSGENCLKPGCGWLPIDWMPEQIIKKSLRDILQKSPETLLAYSSILGYEPLRQLIAERINYHGSSIQHDQILLTDSSTQALDMICRTLLKPGDTVLVDDPCYFNFFTLAQLLQVEVIAIPFTPHGPDPECFALALKKSPKIYITNSGIHNPTGASLNISTAYKILKMAEEANMIIIEDDVYADFEAIPAPRYAALSNFEHVIQVSSFSKSLSASFRCGYIAAKQEYIDVLTKIKIATNFNSNQLNAVLIYQCLKDVQYRRYLEYRNTRLSSTRAHVIHKLMHLGIEPWTLPNAGMFIWCKLPSYIEASALTKLCSDDQVILAPGDIFSRSKTAEHFIRFNVAQCLNEKVFKVLEKNIIGKHTYDI